MMWANFYENGGWGMFPIRRYVRDAARAEEIFHEAFLAVLRERDRSRAMSSFEPWMYRVTRNLCLNALRKERRAAKRARLRRAVAAEVNPEPARRAWSWWERPAAFALAAATVLVALLFVHAVSTGPGAMPRSLDEAPRTLQEAPP